MCEFKRNSVGWSHLKEKGEGLERNREEKTGQTVGWFLFCYPQESGQLCPGKELDQAELRILVQRSMCSNSQLPWR